MADAPHNRPRRKLSGAIENAPVPPVSPVSADDDDAAPVPPAREYTTLTQSVFRLNLAHAEVQRDLLDCQAMHRRVMRMFAHVNAPRDVNEILYRIDRNGPHWDLIVQSVALADPQVLPAGYVTATVRHRSDMLADLQQVQVGQRLLFGLVANVSKRDNESRKRITVRGFAAQRDWLLRKGLDHGFALVEDDTALVPLAIEAESALVGNHRNGSLLFVPVRFSGTLTVTHPQVLVQAVVQGIGSAKAYGCGLLTVRDVG